MKKLILVMLIGVTGFTLTAQPHKRGLAPEEILEFAPSVADKTIDELSIAELLTIAGEFSIKRQENAYIHRATAASFLLPGTGQFITGNTLIGAAHLAGEAAIIGGVLTGFYFLLPEDLQEWDLTGEERRNIVHSYMNPDQIGEILPAMGVAAGGMILSVINSVMASHGAADKARANIDSGVVTFEPYVNAGRSPGLGIRMNW